MGNLILETESIQPESIVASKSGVIQVSKDSTPLPNNREDYLDDEFSPKSSPSILKPYIKVDQGANTWEQKKQQEINGQLEKNYAYYSLTRDLEIDSPRVQKLQQVVDKMCAETNILARVVIMNKGEKLNAFVCPDGTIFVTQSLLNRLDTEDEVAAVLGHELGHLLFETHRYTSAATNDLEKLGIGFVHEKAADSKASLLLQKVGYNSFAFGSAIRKIQGSDRGSVHMSGLTRASLNVGEHFFLDSSTAHQQEKPLDLMFHREAKKTNIEIVKEAAGTKDFQPAQLKAMAEKLHPQDLDQVYKLFWEKRKDNYNFTKNLNELVMERLMQAGYRQEDAILMLYTNPSADLMYGTPGDCYFIDTPEKAVQLIACLQDFEDNKAAHLEMFKLIFAKDISRNQPSATLNLLQLFSQHLYNSEHAPNQKGIPVTGMSLIKFLEGTGQVKLSGDQSHQRANLNTAVLVNFLSKTYVGSTNDVISQKELEELESFLICLKNSAISFNKDKIANEFYLLPRARALHDKNGRKQAVCETACRILGVEINEETFDFKDIDDFFKLYTESNNNYSDKGRRLAQLIRKMKQHFEDEGEDRPKYLAYINKKIAQVVFERSEAVLLEGGESPVLTSAIMKFNLKTVLAMGLFESDTEEFYAFLEPAISELEQVMKHEKVNLQNLSKTRLINLCKNLFHAPDTYGDGLFLYGSYGEDKVDTGEQYGGRITKAGIYDYDSFFKLPLMKIIAEKEDIFNAATVEDLLKQSDQYLTALQFSGLKESGNFNLLEDSALSLVVGRAIMRNFDVILDRGVKDVELGNLYTFVSRFYPGGVEKDQLLRNINKRYLKSSEVSFESKLTYLYQYGEQVGYEGVAIVVDQIEDMATYRIFRERFSSKLQDYLQGKSSVAKVALADNLSAQIVNNFKSLLETCENDPASIKSVSTWYSREWMRAVLDSNSSPAINYDALSEKFTISGHGREIFRSVADTFAKLQILSQAQRFAIAHKALFDSGGAFASLENRQILANTLVSSLGIKQEFVQDLLYTGTLEADAEYIGFPAANMIGSLLFRAFDVNSVDLDRVRDQTVYTASQPGSFGRHFSVKEVMSDEQILRNLRSTTRDIVLFGALARKDLRSRIAQMAEESNQLYYTTSGKLNRLMEEEVDSAEESVARDYEIDPAMEAVIRGVESTGALGIRALQLATQFHNFSENMNKRLSETFDANPGMSRLVFWENLHLRTQENPQVEQFMQGIKLGRYLGGGSLQTTYAATYKTDNRETKEIIIKRKNPSVEGLLKRAYTTSRNVLDTVSQKKGTKESANHAKTGLMLIDLAQQWCIDDLNDRSYEEHDDLFRQTVDKFNQEMGTEQFYVPERIFTEMKVKSEELAPGRTVNQVLKDDTVPESTKQEIVQRMGQFFLYQLRGNSFIDEDKKKFFLIHSDPHIGNYMTDTSSGEKPKIGVIDRSLYLKLDEKDVKVLEKLIGNSNPTDFVYSFINLVLDRNKDRGLTRQVVTARVFVEVAKEYQKQFVRGEIDKFALLRTLLGGLSKQGRETPLELRLMIRNISALQGLMKKYGLMLK